MMLSRPITRHSIDAAKTVQADRVVMGNCPHCGRVVVVLNWHEAWPLVYCECGENFATTSIVNHVRVEDDWQKRQ